MNGPSVPKKWTRQRSRAVLVAEVVEVMAA